MQPGKRDKERDKDRERAESRQTHDREGFGPSLEDGGDRLVVNIDLSAAGQDGVVDLSPYLGGRRQSRFAYTVTAVQLPRIELDDAICSCRLHGGDGPDFPLEIWNNLRTGPLPPDLPWTLRQRDAQPKRFGDALAADAHTYYNMAVDARHAGPTFVDLLSSGVMPNVLEGTTDPNTHRWAVELVNRFVFGLAICPGTTMAGRRRTFRSDQAMTAVWTGRTPNLPAIRAIAPAFYRLPHPPIASQTVFTRAGDGVLKLAAELRRAVFGGPDPGYLAATPVMGTLTLPTAYYIQLDVEEVEDGLPDGDQIKQAAARTSLLRVLGNLNPDSKYAKVLAEIAAGGGLEHAVVEVSDDIGIKEEPGRVVRPTVRVGSGIQDTDEGGPTFE